MIEQFGCHSELLFVVESSEHDRSRECFAEISGTVKAINANAYVIFRAVFDDLHE